MAPTIRRCNEHGGTESKEARKQRLFESRREREFYSYYESVLAYASKGPKFCDLHDPMLAATHEAVCSMDTTLTALTQLAALRLGAKRSMIFFFDSEYAYVIAESTRTLSLHNAKDHDPGDSLWLGFTKIPRGLSVCEVTANLPVNEGSNAQDPDTNRIAHIINDLTEDVRFCDRPYVSDGPKARFYAGVPISTPKGINIGAICVLDDKPRDGLELGEVELLQSLASAVMSHLEMVRIKEDNLRSRDMNTALGAFVEGKSDPRDWWHRSGRSRTDDEGPTDSGPREPRIQTFSDRVPKTPNAIDQLAENFVGDGYFAASSERGVSANTEATRTHNLLSVRSPTEALPPNGPNVESRKEPGGLERPRSPANAKEDDTEDDLSSRIKATASRAAGLIQKGLGADGVLFLDASVGSFGGLIDGAQGLSQTETETEGSHVSDVGTHSRKDGSQRRKPATSVKFAESPRHSGVLGSAYSTDIGPQVREAIEQAKFSERTLRSLLRRYPDGQVWHFNADGEASDEDDNASDEGFSTDAGDSGGSELEQNISPSNKRAAKKIRSRKRDGRAIQSIFPGIRSLVFLGMWDPHHERWFGASIILSYSSTRMFSARSELSYLAAFCDVVLAEIWRLESQELGRSKSDFISSISHELRSPLHGILGSAECLEEHEQSSLSRELIQSINSCGTTLLDVINDLLEYSRLNHGTQKRRNENTHKTASVRSQASTASDPSTSESGVMVNSLTEDAVNAACLGFDHQTVRRKRKGKASNEDPAVLSLSIDEAQNPDWLLCIPKGSWKRICLNLVLNALKYTPSGYIGVTLRQKWAQKKTGSEQTALVELIVEDSGIGMSEEFQTKSLFRPFKQENSLASGTGLGLNLVAQIVKSQGGTVHVRSAQGVGTTVTVSVPLQRPSKNVTGATPAKPMNFSALNASVGFFGFDTRDTDPTMEASSSEANDRLLNSLKASCEQLGLDVSSDGHTANTNPTIHIVRMEVVDRLLRDGKATRDCLPLANNLGSPVIVVCPSRDAALKFRDSPIAAGLPVKLHFVWVPVGPLKLAGVISDCLKRRTSDDRNVASAAPAEVSISSTAIKSTQVSLESTNDILAADALASESSAKPAIASTNTEVVHAKDEVSQPPRHRKSGSESSPRPDTASIQLQTQLGRAMTDPYRGTGALSLLLVDDNVWCSPEPFPLDIPLSVRVQAINLRLLEVFAKKAGYSYRTARNGQEAVEIYEGASRSARSSDDSLTSNPGNGTGPAGKPQVVLMDINMPVMDGFEAARAIRRFETASGSPRATIIAITGLGDTSAQEQSFTSGMDLFLTKPVKMKEVTGILKKVQGTDT